MERKKLIPQITGGYLQARGGDDYSVLISFCISLEDSFTFLRTVTIFHVSFGIAIDPLSSTVSHFRDK